MNNKYINELMQGYNDLLNEMTVTIDGKIYVEEENIFDYASLNRYKQSLKLYLVADFAFDGEPNEVDDKIKEIKSVYKRKSKLSNSNQELMKSLAANIRNFNEEHDEEFDITTDEYNEMDTLLKEFFNYID